MSIVEEMKDLINKLNYYTELYDKGEPAISDEAWDNMYFRLKDLEDKYQIYLDDSPTSSISFTVVNELEKVKHNHLMLSLNKTKDIDEIKSFLKKKDYIAMLKLDGLTCSLQYKDGKLVAAETRGNGEVGENILHNALVIPSIPKEIDYKDELVVDGEIICTYNNFKEFENEYKNPRNFASGSIRLLDSKECFSRHLTFVAWDVVKGGKYNYLSNNLADLRAKGFITVPCSINGTVEENIEQLKQWAKNESYPIDGIVFKYDNIKEYDAAGKTSHHFSGGLALKFYDETYETHLLSIDYDISRNGILTPVAVFESVDIDGSEVSRASLSNLSVMEETLGKYPEKGQTIWVSKRNMIIPKIEQAIKNDTPHDHILDAIISYCPICGEPTITKISDSGIKTLICSNTQCSGKLINVLDHFAGKKGLDIKNLSKATFEKLIDWNWIEKIEDIYTLYNHRGEWITKPGFGVLSVDKILKSIEESKNTSLSSFISALGIPLIGITAAKQLEKEFKTYENFKAAVNNNEYYFLSIEGFGDEMNYQLKKYDYTEADRIAKLLNFIQKEEVETNDLNGLVFVITGKLTKFKNRTELKDLILSKGGKVSDSVTSKTSFLINNDVNSVSSKNKTAQKLNVPIISEEEFMQHYVEK